METEEKLSKRKDLRLMHHPEMIHCCSDIHNTTSEDSERTRGCS